MPGGNLDRPETKLELARRLVAERLSATFKQWAIEKDLVRGPGALDVLVQDHQQAGDSHLDIGFVVDRERTDLPVLWDCAAGLGLTGRDGISRAVEIWAASTLPVCLELVTRKGSFADHFHGDDPEGCVGWHVIHGPWWAFGEEAAALRLQAWAIDNPLLPTVGKLAAKSFSRSELNCVKLFFGFDEEEIAEVRVNGDYDRVASEYLKTLPWPRAAERAWARCYLLFVHSE